MFARRDNDSDYTFHSVPEHFVDEIEQEFLYSGVNTRNGEHKSGDDFPYYEVTKYVDAGATPKAATEEVDQCVMAAAHRTDFTDVIGKS